MADLLRARGVSTEEGEQGAVAEEDLRNGGGPLAPRSPAHERPPEEAVRQDRIRADDNALFVTAGQDNEDREHDDEDEEDATQQDGSNGSCRSSRRTSGEKTQDSSVGWSFSKAESRDQEERLRTAQKHYSQRRKYKDPKPPKDAIPEAYHIFPRRRRRGRRRPPRTRPAAPDE